MRTHCLGHQPEDLGRESAQSLGNSGHLLLGLFPLLERGQRSEVPRPPPEREEETLGPRKSKQQVYFYVALLLIVIDQKRMLLVFSLSVDKAVQSLPSGQLLAGSNTSIAILTSSISNDIVHLK